MPPDLHHIRQGIPVHDLEGVGTSERGGGRRPPLLLSRRVRCGAASRSRAGISGNQRGRLQCLGRRRIEKTGRLLVVVAVHMFGQPADMDSLADTCGEIPVIEDCAQALFSEYKGSPVGSRSLVSFFSFRSGKYISAGEGSAILCQGHALGEKIRGLVDRYEDWRWDRQIVHALSTYVMSLFYRPPLYGWIGYRAGKGVAQEAGPVPEITVQIAEDRSR